MNNKIQKVVLLITLMFNTVLFAQTTVSSSEILKDVKKLGKLGTVLYIAAHPDDENTRLISYLTNYENVDVSYLSLTRGDGGQNLIGTEIGEQLGLVRTQELLAARRIDGASQFFTRAIDFGYSKTPEETFNFWEKEEVLSDVVWVIRNLKPDIIITRFSPEVNEDRPTHGHHTASAMLAVEAFAAAADPTKFTDQLDKVDIWETKQIYWNTSYWFYGSVEEMDNQVAKAPNQYLKINVNQYLPLMGKSGSDISAHSRSQHKSQGFGNTPVKSEQWEYLQLLKGEGVPSTLLSETNTSFEKAGFGNKIDKMISKVIEAFDVSHPEKSIDALFGIRDEIAQINDQSIKRKKLEQVHSIILKCAGFKADALSKEQLIHVGQSLKTSVELSSNIDITVKEIQPAFFETISSGGTNLKSGRYYSKTIDWTVPETIYQPYWLSGEKKLGLYNVVNPMDIGLPENDYPFYLNISLEINEHPIKVKIPMTHGSNDPVKGPVVQPLVVVPNVMVNIDRDVYVFTSEESKTIDVEVVSGKPNTSGYVELIVPTGWKCEPMFYKTETGSVGESKHYSFEVTPTKTEVTGSIKAVFKDDEYIYGRGFYQLKYDHIPEVALYPPSEAKAVKVSLYTSGKRIGYVAGAGDKVAESTQEMGYAVVPLTIQDLQLQDLNQYDAIVFGIRALNTLEGLGSVNEKLTKYVSDGGNLVMQYNTSHRQKHAPLGPYEITLSRDRVTEEDAEVVFLAPDHKVLNSPNKLSPSDFNHWVQERGLYFPNKWDEGHFTEVLGMHDSGEDMKKGSLIIAKHGDGNIVYTGLSFFRELPAGVSGAYRLWANILSL